jgi:hypothetical protein
MAHSSELNCVLYGQVGNNNFSSCFLNQFESSIFLEFETPGARDTGSIPTTLVEGGRQGEGPSWLGNQGCGSGSQLDPDSIGSVDSDPYTESGSGSRRAKITHKSRKYLRNFMFWSAGCSFLRPEGFFCNLDVLYGGLGMGKLLFLIKKI